jgi:hypothetical protein
MNYILIDRRSQPGRNGTQMWRLTWWCIDDDTAWEMTVDSSYRNFRQSGWDHVVNHDCPWGVYSGLQRTGRRTAAGTGVLTADSPADLIHRLENHDQALDMAEQSRLFNTHHAQYHDLFEKSYGR